jgi:hypothetical protein
MLLKQVAELQKRVKELERELAAAEAEAITLRAAMSEKTNSVSLEEEPALA